MRWWSSARTTALAAGVLAAATLAGAATHRTATGTLAGYDPATRVLTVRSATGTLEFRVATDARAWAGNRRIPVREIGAHAGAQVTVAWSDSAGVKTTHTVRVTEMIDSARGR